MATSFTKVGISKLLLEKLAASRLQEFKFLSSSPHVVAAVYLAGYGIEALLKCAACRTLDTDDLPVNFQIHNLDDLLLLAGLKKKIGLQPGVAINFRKLADLWNNGQLR